jgi:hypothetical protein|tara:strand:+ start:1184 stop:1618 length:435 start_codon:yes stop_codon:yes gene_type:complete
MRSDFLNESSGSTFGLKKKVEKLVAAVTLTNEDSGKVFMCDSAGGAYQITLPTASTGEEGVHYKFIVDEETPTGDITIAAGSAIISLVQKDAGGNAANSTAGTQVSNVILDTTAQKGDYVELMFVGGEYVGSSMSGIDNGIQTS